LAALLAPFLFSRVIALFVGLALVLSNQNQPSEGSIFSVLGGKYLAISVFSTSLLSFAFFYGLIIVPPGIRSTPVTRVLLAVEIPNLEGSVGLSSSEPSFWVKQKEVAVQGRLMFHLSHSLLLLVERHGTPLVVIPEEKVERIESPKFHFKPTPSPVAKASP
jgi:hypothetical protein